VGNLKFVGRMDELQSRIHNSTEIQSIDDSKLKLQKCISLFEAFETLSDGFVKEGRVTKALELLQRGTSILAGVAEWVQFKSKLQLQIVCLAFEINLGVDLKDADVISPLTLVALATEVEHYVATFGIVTGQQRMCCLDWKLYDAILPQLEKLARDDQVEHIYIAACIRTAIVGIKSDKIENALDLLKLACTNADRLSDPLLKAKCLFALGLAESSRKTSLKNETLSKRVIVSALSHFESSLETFLSSDSESALVVRVEIGKTYYENGEFIQCVRVLQNINEMEAEIIDSKEEQYVHHWPVIVSLLQKAYLQACSSAKDNQPLKDAYKTLLTKRDAVRPSILLQEIAQYQLF